MITDRILKIIELNKENKSQFYKKTGLSNGFLDKVKDIGVSKLEHILNSYPSINPEWLLTGKGEMLKQNALINVKSLSETRGIPMLPFDAFAGIGDDTISGVDFDTIEERYVIPLFDGIKIDFMIPVRGSSMYPKYSSGDVVACRLVEEILFVQWNKVYVIDTISQGVIMKRLLKGKSTDHIICKSDNKDYDEFPVPMNDIRSIALVVGVIRLE
ncbi:MAG: helix-turn-helix transcriptional regulator [Flavobacterium sp.]|uniref:S24 family peptidase n=1 Tax=Flavobacterium sp. TaxID=239 RepID=UPI00391BB253